MCLITNGEYTDSFTRLQDIDIRISRLANNPEATLNSARRGSSRPGSHETSHIPRVSRRYEHGSVHSSVRYIGINDEGV